MYILSMLQPLYITLWRIGFYWEIGKITKSVATVRGLPHSCYNVWAVTPVRTSNVCQAVNKKIHWLCGAGFVVKAHCILSCVCQQWMDLIICWSDLNFPFSGHDTQILCFLMVMIYQIT